MVWLDPSRDAAMVRELALVALQFSRSCQMMAFVQFLNQLLVLLGVIVGALSAYLTTSVTEHARWKRA